MRRPFGGFLYLTVAAFFAGLVVSTFRWLLIDSIHSHTGLKQPLWNFAKLADRQEAFAMLVDAHYRYYQFYANSMIALVISRSVVGQCLASLAGNWLWVLCWRFCSLPVRVIRCENYYQRVDALLASAAG